MIVSKRILIAVGVVIVIIALVIAVPKISPSGQGATNTPTEMRIEFIKEEMKRVSFGVTESVGAEKSETLTIMDDGTAFYNVNVEGERGSQTKFQAGAQELKRIKALIAETGFMQIPREQFEPRDGVMEFTRYTLTATLGSSTKTIQWVDEESSKDSVPALLARLKDSLLELIKNHQ
ncbi:MAG: hypothetical protein ACRD5H_07805 [Nitrososphaerales archaeon]